MPTRRSTRASGPQTRYSTDAFEVAGINGEPDGEAAGAAARKALNHSDESHEEEEGSSDEEFQDAPDEGELENGEDEDEDNSEEDEPMVDIDGSGSPVPAGGRGRGNKKKANEGPAISQPPPSATKRRSDGPAAVKKEETHSRRGILNPVEYVGKTLHLQVAFGTDERDLLALVYARDRWSKGMDSGFPSRASLNAAQTAPDYTYGPTFGADPEDVKKESTRGWDWYYHKRTGEEFKKRQHITKIDEDEARRTYMPQPRTGKHTVLLGPANNQKQFTLGQHESINFGEAWGEKEAKNRPAEEKRKVREGWILNMGQKVQAMAWAPNHDGLLQYLAVVSPIDDNQKARYFDPLADKAAPAFRPSAPYPSALQIWMFKAREEESYTKAPDMEFKPQLRLVLCTDWGDLRRISWCPSPRAKRDEDKEDAMETVGLLAGVYGDGCVRVLDVKVSRDSNPAKFYKLHSPAFTARPPSTVCTCIVWLSPSDIAVGCANGFVAVWSILPSQKSSPSAHPLPYFYQQIHSTYILSISPAYPTHPHLVCTTSIDGETRLTSLLDPQKDMVETNRMRVGSSFTSYSPWLHSFVSSDENDFARLLALRRFFATTSIARLSSSVSALAPCSPCHPSMLLGCTGGAVVATNPLRRLLHSKEKQWQQTWFVHEWVQGSSEAGVSRFDDGFRAESVSLLRNTLGDRKMVNGTMVITIFDENTHVTALSWNPNQTCGGWASAGMGCGLVRVEDLALS